MAEKIEEFILTSEIIKDIEERENLGKLLKRYEKLWFSNTRGVRKPYLTFAMTEDEFEEYIKCKIDIHYFAESYCQIKREDGTVGPMKLRSYQKDIIDLYSKNPRSILMASRQTGKCLTFNTLASIENSDKKIVKIPIGLLYYNELMKERKLTLLEKIKIKLYYFIYKLQ
jgi:hypothetical protein